jgi:YidC/Oxa1 family membrane protein insertase
LAIILLTLAIKAAFWSMTEKQYESMSSMRKIQPKIKELQQKHKQDPQKMQQEMMVLYKEHGVNPFSGCLPMLIQLPFMIALFSTLSNPAFLMKSAGKAFLWIKNISFVETLNFAHPGKLPPAQLQYIAENHLTGFNSYLAIGASAIPLLALLVAISTYFSQKTMDIDPEQQQMMALMPVMLFFLSYNLNAGVLLYWVVSNLVTTFQQLYIKRNRLVKEELAVVEIDRPGKK